MRLFGKLLILPLMLIAAASCSKDEATTDDPEQPVVTLLQCPSKAEAGKPVTVIAGVTIGTGTISSVTLYYNDGTEKSVAMDETSVAGEYSAVFTAPSTVGTKITYYVKATTGKNITVQSGNVILTAVEEGSISNPTAGLRLSEIGTSGDYKFIEIHNPSGDIANLGGVSLWKNGEELVSFSSSVKVYGNNYGVYRAKGTTFAIPASAADLGTTETGLSGSKSLSVELRYNGEVIDAFANTINPGVAQMTADDWDGTPETEGVNFIRRSGDTYGWYAAPSLAAPTPGKANGTSGTRLKHQLLADDAVASMPYITGAVINPDEPAVGLTPSKNVIRFSVYCDVHSAGPSVTSDKGSVSHVSGVVYEIRPSLSGSASGTETTIKMTAANASGSYVEEIKVLVYPDGQAFGSYGDIRLNEIYTQSNDAIELYNTSDKPVVIAGMRIRKNKDRIFTVPGYKVMKGKGYAVLGCNGKAYNGSGGALDLGTVSNGLSGSKSLLIELRKPKEEGDETNSVNIDDFVNIALSVSSPDKDSAWDTDGLYERDFECAGRHPDGSGDWYVLNGVTIGKTNSTATRGVRFTQSYHQ